MGKSAIQVQIHPTMRLMSTEVPNAMLCFHSLLQGHTVIGPCRKAFCQTRIQLIGVILEAAGAGFAEGREIQEETLAYRSEGLVWRCREIRGPVVARSDSGKKSSYHCDHHLFVLHLDRVDGVIRPLRDPGWIWDHGDHLCQSACDD